MTDRLEEILNYVPISEHIGTGGQPTAEQFELLRAAGYEMIVNLALPTSRGAIPHEGALVAALGMTYVNIPVLWESPAHADFELFTALMNTFGQRKVFVHCALNMRVSCFIYLYRVVTLGVAPAAAEPDLLRIWQPEGVWADFMTAVLNGT